MDINGSRSVFGLFIKKKNIIVKKIVVEKLGCPFLSSQDVTPLVNNILIGKLHGVTLIA